MKALYRAFLTLVPALLTLMLFVGGAAATPAMAQTSGDEPAPQEASPPADEPDSADADQAEPADAEKPDDELTHRERKEQAKEERIQDYLRRREERRAQKEMDREQRAARKAEDEARRIESEQLAAEQKALAAASEAAALEEEPSPEIDAPVKARKKRGRTDQPAASRLPRGLARAQNNVRANELSLDPTVRDYLDLIDEQGASPQQLAAFGSFIAQNGLVDDALAYYDVAVRLEPNDPVMLVNHGSLFLQKGELSAAASMFSRALGIDPNNAVAHYNLGATFDRMNKYDDAVFEYKTALTLDPSLGDPSVNPQAANNDLMLAVRLMLYQEQAGSLSVPLLDVMTGDLQTADDGVGE
jgi:tetratricopeptide (TPR) repeat protein